MNWIKISKKYPKANNLFSKWIDGHGMIDYEMRDLYDFFDEQKMWITISQSSNEECGTLYNTWEYLIEWLEGNTMNEEFFKTRKKAEQMAFEKAFEILENNLINK